MDINYDPNPTSVTREIIEEGLIDLDCQVKTFGHLPGKKAVKVLHQRINPERTANRALAFCGTRYRR